MYKFIKTKKKQNPYDIVDIEMMIDDATLDEMLENYGNFLRACGFVFEGQLGIVTED